VQGSGWPAGAEVLFGWEGTGAAARSYTSNATATPDGGGNFTASFTVTGSEVTEGKHTLYALVILTGQQAQAALYVPCSSVPTPTPTWTATPTNTPTSTATPVRKPDLKISNLSIQSGEITTWTGVTINTTVRNDSTGPCNNTFWTDLYVYTDTLRVPLPREDGVRYQALSYLGPNSSTDMPFSYMFTISDTYYVYTRADTYENVSEISEDNNVSQPMTVTVVWGGPTPTPTATATQDPTCGSIGGTVWAFIGGEIVVLTERVNMSLFKNGPVATTVSDEYGNYFFNCVPAGTGYLVDGLIIIDNVPYYGYQSGIQVLANQETSPVDIILAP
jgi:hypothetical protein